MNDGQRFFLLIVIILIIILHLLITWGVFYTPFQFYTPRTSPLLVEKEAHQIPPTTQPQRDWAAMRSGGASVILQQSPMTTQSQQTTQTHAAMPHPNIIDGEQEKEYKENTVESPDTSITSEEEKDAQINESSTDHDEPLLETKNTQELKKSQEATTIRVVDKTKKNLTDTTTEDKQDKIENKHEAIKQDNKENNRKSEDIKATEKQKKESLKEQEKFKTKLTEPSTTSSTESLEQKRIPSFSQMLNNYSNQPDGGTDPYTMQGKNKGKATADQLKHGNYRNKIAQCIQNGILTNRTKAVIRHDGIYSLTINLIIASNGGIKHLSIQESSKVASLDMFILRAVQDAASSFPPVPTSLSTDAYHMPISFENVVAIIEHPEQLRWIL